MPTIQQQSRYFPNIQYNYTITRIYRPCIQRCTFKKLNSMINIIGMDSNIKQTDKIHTFKSHFINQIFTQLLHVNFV